MILRIFFENFAYVVGCISNRQKRKIGANWERDKIGRNK